jgi:hypothetical protein
MFFKILFLILFTSLNVAHADPKGLYLCNHVWTTKPCDSPEAVLPYSESTQDPAKSEERQRKNEIEKILHPIRIKSSELGNTYNARYDISYVELLCDNPLTTLTECRDAAINEHEKILNYELKLRDQELRKSETEEKINNPEVTIHHNYPPPIFGIRNGQHIHPRLGPRTRPHQIQPQRGDPPYTQQIPRANPGQSLSIPSIRHRGN